MAISYVYVDQKCSQSFAVVNRDTELLVGGIDATDFDVDIYDPDGSNRDGDSIWMLTEKYPDSGYYKFEFTPDTTGDWLVSIKHDEYFPWGKSADYTVVTESYYAMGDSTVSGTSEILDLLDDILVLILSDM